MRRSAALPPMPPWANAARDVASVLVDEAGAAFRQSGLAAVLAQQGPRIARAVLARLEAESRQTGARRRCQSVACS